MLRWFWTISILSDGRTHDRRILYDFWEGVKAVWQHGFKP
jgi:hypothetical protein